MMTLTHNPMQPNPERDQQLFLDGLQVAGVIRVRGEVQQVMSSLKIQQKAIELAGMIAVHQQTHHQLLHVRQVNGVDGAGVVSVILRVT